MFDIAPTELMLLGAVALVVIGPKDLPRAMRFVGQWVGRARGMARHFRLGMDEIIRQAELEEMQKKWAAENARIMAEHPMPPAEEADDAAYAHDGRPAMTPLPEPIEDTSWPPREPVEDTSWPPREPDFGDEPAPAEATQASLPLPAPERSAPVRDVADESRTMPRP